MTPSPIDMTHSCNKFVKKTNCIILYKNRTYVVYYLKTNNPVLTNFTKFIGVDWTFSKYWYNVTSVHSHKSHCYDRLIQCNHFHRQQTCQSYVHYLRNQSAIASLYVCDNKSCWSQNSDNLDEGPTRGYSDANVGG